MPDAPLPLPEPPAPTRRTVLRGAAAAGALAASGYATTDAYAADGRRDGGYRLTVLGTTDLHGNVFNWDYFKDAEYDDSAHNDIGLAKVSTLVSAMRGERGAAQHAADRRRRHHPGHAAGLLLRQDRADHRAARRTRWPRR